jgi:type VI secretion system secreted protein VgrG
MPSAVRRRGSSSNRREGIFCLFHQENGRHTAIFADAPFAFRPGQRENVSFVPEAAWEQVHGWQHAYEFRPGRWILSDYDFKKPRTDLTASQPTVIDNPGMKKFELFDYPGKYFDENARDGLTRTRIEAEEATYHVVNGSGKVPSFRTGETFTLKDHPIARPARAPARLSEIAAFSAGRPTLPKPHNAWSAVSP